MSRLRSSQGVVVVRDQVEVTSVEKPAIIAWVEPGVQKYSYMVGLKLEVPVGNSEGTYKNKRFLNCTKSHDIQSVVQKLDGNIRRKIHEEELWDWLEGLGSTACFKFLRHRGLSELWRLWSLDETGISELVSQLSRHDSIPEKAIKILQMALLLRLRTRDQRKVHSGPPYRPNECLRNNSIYKSNNYRAKPRHHSWRYSTERERWDIEYNNSEGYVEEGNGRPWIANRNRKPLVDNLNSMRIKKTRRNPKMSSEFFRTENELNPFLNQPRLNNVDNVGVFRSSGMGGPRVNEHGHEEGNKLKWSTKPRVNESLLWVSNEDEVEKNPIGEIPFQNSHVAGGRSDISLTCSISRSQTHSNTERKVDTCTDELKIFSSSSEEEVGNKQSGISTQHKVQRKVQCSPHNPVLSRGMSVDLPIFNDKSIDGEQKHESQQSGCPLGKKSLEMKQVETNETTANYAENPPKAFIQTMKEMINISYEASKNMVSWFNKQTLEEKDLHQVNVKSCKYTRQKADHIVKASTLQKGDSKETMDNYPKLKKKGRRVEGSPPLQEEKIATGQNDPKQLRKLKLDGTQELIQRSMDRREGSPLIAMRMLDELRLKEKNTDLSSYTALRKGLSSDPKHVMSLLQEEKKETGQNDPKQVRKLKLDGTEELIPRSMDKREGSPLIAMRMLEELRLKEKNTDLSSYTALTKGLSSDPKHVKSLLQGEDLDALYNYLVANRDKQQTGESEHKQHELNQTPDLNKGDVAYDYRIGQNVRKDSVRNSKEEDRLCASLNRHIDKFNKEVSQEVFETGLRELYNICTKLAEDPTRADYRSLQIQQGNLGPLLESKSGEELLGVLGFTCLNKQTSTFKLDAGIVGGNVFMKFGKVLHDSLLRSCSNSRVLGKR